MTSFTCAKRPATGSRGVVCTNHPLASAAGAEVLVAGGNAVDAAIASLFALTVVEPMMVGILGGGVAHLRLADGRHIIVDGLSTAPAAAFDGMYRMAPGAGAEVREAADRANAVGALAVAVPGALRAWAQTLERHGTWPLADVLEPAIRLAARGFAVTPYLSDAIGDCRADLARDPDLAARFLPDGAPLRAGARLVQGAYAETLRAIAREGVEALHGGAVGTRLVEGLAAAGGIMTQEDLRRAAPVERAPVVARYRGFEIHAPPPPSSAGVHMTQMLNILEGFDLRALGFGTVETTHLLAEVLKIAFADRAVATADPAFVEVPVARLTAKDHAAARRAAIRMDAAQDWAPDPGLRESPNTTHVTVADAMGNVVASTQTINSLFGARIGIPGTGMIANNYMLNFEPRPGQALSVAPGKRVFTSMAPSVVTQDGRLRWALGQPGGLRIFGSTMQAILNLIDHGMELQRAVEAPRAWTQGFGLELEPAFPDEVAAALAARGHRIERVRTIGGGLNAIEFYADGSMTGAACWRGDGTVVALGGGLARAGVRFSPDAPAKA
ncbi:gamma-glutamyltransferase [Falsiroseomonas oryziterrae]|uniref:gamma-glutamyltransferase n=1 Tax=Falsiroseomonas oryziterrae TaxID=2911368 RepID=UPI001F01781F|nr:gamma-glutamyltransferase [Roseomonas sp. NPKOSM-4]